MPIDQAIPCRLYGSALPRQVDPDRRRRLARAQRQESLQEVPVAIAGTLDRQPIGCSMLWPDRLLLGRLQGIGEFVDGGGNSAGLVAQLARDAKQIGHVGAGQAGRLSQPLGAGGDLLGLRRRCAGRRRISRAVERWAATAASTSLLTLSTAAI